MARFLVLAAFGLMLTALWRLFRRETARVAETLAEVRAPSPRAAGSRLLRGTDGVYRPDLGERTGN